MIPYYVFCILIVTHIGLFALGALAYHGIRMLAVRPIYPQQQPQAARMNEAKLQQMASRLAQQQATAALFGHLNPMGDVPVQPRQQFIPEGDGRPPKEEAFAPMTAKK